MRSKQLGRYRKPITEERALWIETRFRDDPCKAQFLIWAQGTNLDTHSMWDGEPIFRPAICAWEAWKAAWSLLKTDA